MPHPVPFVVNVPVLETERLRLRGPRADDLDACAALWADTEVVRHTTGKPQTREEVWWRILRYIGHWALMGYGFWALEEKASGAFVGEVGFADFKRNLDPPLGDTPESGWILASAFHGKGYATEAMRAVIAWGDEHFEAARTACLIHPDNAASLRVAEKLGYREYARSTYRDKQVLMLERLASETARTS
jgi:RimJ/RimL family protein N-acetyltransferase